ncbi:MAG TPA: hypothetical protein VMT17_02815 [Anaeromyxobacteraceae bacterium]|nr:hypothetical protein [Anaeromyxobacteraceae bacterium]
MRMIIAACLFALSTSVTTNGWAKDNKMPNQMDCDQLATIPNAPMSVETCKQMMGAMQQGNGPAGARPGDENMSCSDIKAEMKTMTGVGISDAQRKENATASSEHQALIAKQQAQVTEFAAEATAATQAAAAADMATQVVTGGLVHGKAAQATAEAYQARADAMGKQMAEERKPSQDRVMNAASASTKELSQGMQSNPRFSRLIQLGIAKDCKD